MGIFSKVRGENKTYLKPPPGFFRVGGWFQPTHLKHMPFVKIGDFHLPPHFGGRTLNKKSWKPTPSLLLKARNITG